MQDYNPNLEIDSMPSRIKALPICDRFKMPVPWFVAWQDGKPEFRAMDGRRFNAAIREKRCWVCGDFLGRRMTFVIGPMCGINRVSSEPPSHLECAQWSARNCPFLSNANRKRREDEAINNTNFAENCSGMAITRNPGVTLLWTTRDYMPFSDGRGGVLIKIGEPETIEFYREGRHATRAEIDESVNSGLPILVEAAEKDGEKALLELGRMRGAFGKLLPT